MAGALAPSPSGQLATGSQVVAQAEDEHLRFAVPYHFSMNKFTGDDEPGNVSATTYNPAYLDEPQWMRVAHRHERWSAGVTVPEVRPHVVLIFE